MVKRITAVLLVLVMAFSCVTVAAAAKKNSQSEEEGWTTIKGKQKTSVKLKKKYADNPVEEGINSLTGLAASGEAYTPILMVLDNTPESQPHWGVRYADIMFQIHNMGGGNTKLMALFASEYPEIAGGARSGRAQMIPIAMSFGAAFAYAGTPPFKSSDTGNYNPNYLMNKWNMNKEGKKYDLLGKNAPAQRESWLGGSHNLSAKIKTIHEDLIAKGTEFTQRPFKFTDEPRTEGADASRVKVLFRSDAKDDAKNTVNVANSCMFVWDSEKNGYIRNSESGDYRDRQTDETLLFSNVIVLRCTYGHKTEYMWLDNAMIGSGNAEIFQNGKYIQGGWKRVQGGRIVIVDGKGNELEMQRGRSFFVITNANTYVRYQ